MTTLALAIEKQARKLSAPERERLVERLMVDMKGERLTTVDEAWVDEAERRFSAWKRKLTKPLSATKALHDIRKELRR
jgi:putative addiction module component (TIGR02574 family)